MILKVSATGKNVIQCTTGNHKLFSYLKVKVFPRTGPMSDTFRNYSATGDSLKDCGVTQDGNVGITFHGTWSSQGDRNCNKI